MLLGEEISRRVSARKEIACGLQCLLALLAADIAMSDEADLGG
jgi:hypothetical protein